VKVFVILNLFLILLLGACSSSSASNTHVIKGQHLSLQVLSNMKKRVKGKVVTRSKWLDMPKELSIHMGSYDQLRIDKTNSTFLDVKKVVLTYSSKNKKVFQETYNINQKSYVVEKLDFDDVFEFKMLPRPGSLELVFKDNKNNKKKIIIPVLGSQHD
tara:strand:+ start:33158 stop:33631 length:474 start_codon:yes stop_codon:yes gene_type:complete